MGLEIQSYLKPAQCKHDFVLRFLEDRYSDVIKKYHSIEQMPSCLTAESNIFVCWIQGKEKMPEPIKHCVSSIIKYAGGFRVHIITMENYRQFVSIPTGIIGKVERGEISLTHFSDILRCNLLSDYGGIWIDAALLLTGKIQVPQLPFFTLKQKAAAKGNNSFVSNYQWIVGYMGGVKGNVLFSFMKDFLNTYAEREPMFIDYFLLDYVVALAYKTIPAVRKMINDVPYSNEDFYYICSHLFEPVNKCELESVLKRTRVFKLGYKDFPHKIDKDTLYAYLLEATLEDEDA